MFKILIFGLVMFGLGFAYGRDKNLWQKTIDFVKKIVDKIKELIRK